MKLIKNGKLFGVLNIRDIAIITFILVIVLPMLHYYIKFNEKGLAEERLLKRFIKQHKRSTVGFQTGPQSGVLDVDISFKSLTREDLGRIKVGDKEVLPDETVLAEILWIGKPAPNYFIVDLGRGNESILKRIIKDDLYSLPVKLRVNGLIRDSGNFFYKTRMMKRFTHYIFKSKDYEADFVVEARGE